MTSPIVKSLTLYPLKSAKGIPLQKMEVDAWGPRWDREWMLVKKKNKSFVSQRTHPQMSQLNCQITKHNLVISHPDQETLEIPLSERNENEIQVSLFQKELAAEKVGDIFDQWFSDFLKADVELVRTPKTHNRQTSGRHGPPTPLRFADGYPFLLTNSATLDELNLRLEAPVTMSRFRPNIEIEHAQKDAEDSWKSFRINDVSFLAVKACTRCAVIDVDPASGQRGKRVSQELKTYRFKDGNVLFGVNLSHQNTGWIHVGDALTDFN